MYHMNLDVTSPISLVISVVFPLEILWWVWPWLHGVGRRAILSVVSGKTIELRVTVGNCLCDFIWIRYQNIPFGISTSSVGQVGDFPQSIRIYICIYHKVKIYMYSDSCLKGSQGLRSQSLSVGVAIKYTFRLTI